MGYNVFVSYKYHDNTVKSLGNGRETVRDYVDELERILGKSSSYRYRGEKDGNDLSELNEDTITNILADMIYYTSVTIVLISPNMAEPGKTEREQWIPWEVSYSLKESRRESGKSHTNAIIAVVLPDRSGNYDYMIESHGCHRTTKTDKLFPILANNMFNKKGIESIRCSCGCAINPSGSSYIPIVTWDSFKNNVSYYLEEAIRNRENKEQFQICKTLSG